MAELTVDRGAVGTRLDRWLSTHLPTVSRARLQALIVSGRIQVDGRSVKTAYRLRGGEHVTIQMPPPIAEDLVPEPVMLAIVHEDDQVLVVDKPAGMVVHPGAGHARGTLVAAALAHAPGIAGVGGPRRPGIVHRLDKGTSGLLVLAKTREAYDSLVAQLASRVATRRYLAVVHGQLAANEGIVDKPIGRDPRDRVRMAVRPPGRGKRAVTRWRVLERFPKFTCLEVSLETGRTHQIRVHLAWLGHSVVGDDVYGGRRSPPVPVHLDGYALHAATLGFTHPATGCRGEFQAPLPARMAHLLTALRQSAPSALSRPRDTPARRR